MEQEIITSLNKYNDDWICTCKNTPADDGFYDCTEQGKLLARGSGSDYLLCYRCGRVIDFFTHRVVYQLSPDELLETIKQDVA
ncbi:hypothetical protein QQ054_04220 [Oscillatoria amoena NRMC-F 0135]|nr:hypothetical protein [Oscillatoria amoena NRMC-F 0135]